MRFSCGHESKIMCMCDDPLCFTKYALYLADENDLCFDCWIEAQNAKEETPK